MSIRSDIRDHPIRAFAVLCVAGIALFIAWMSYKLNETLAGAGWCKTAIGADRADLDSEIDIAASCVGLLTIQLKSVATNSHILFGSLALCLVTLIVVVIAGARLAGKGPAGVEIDVGPAVNAAADQVAEAAQDEAETIRGG